MKYFLIWESDKIKVGRCGIDFASEVQAKNDCNFIRWLNGKEQPVAVDTYGWREQDNRRFATPRFTHPPTISTTATWGTYTYDASSTSTSGTVAVTNVSGAYVTSGASYYDADGSLGP